MGLNISYYAKATPAPDGNLEDWENFGEFFPNNEHFPGRADGIVEGIYRVEGGGSLAAGSYSGYNRWREQLAILAGYDADPAADDHHKHSSTAWKSSGGPFWELIHFSDCDGVIGPKASAKLAKDFGVYQPDADKHPDDWFRRKYAEWRTAFETAADHGLVDFH